GGSEQVATNAQAVNTIVSSGGILNVRQGVSFGAVLNSGGTELVSLGTPTAGTDFGAIIAGGTQLDFSYASGVTILAGSQVVESGGSASATVVSGGTEIVSSGGTDIGATLSGGTQLVFGTALGVHFTGGEQQVKSGGFASGTVGINGGTMSVSSGGLASGATL